MADLGSYPSFETFRNACGVVDVKVSRETFDRLQLYVALLGEYNRKFNLIGPNEISKIWTRHVLDSVQIFPHIPKSASIVDIGSGAGFPGIVLSLLGCSPVTLVESSTKKCKFLKKVSCEAIVLNERIENITGLHFGGVVSRAVAPLGRLLEYVSFVGGRDTVCVFNKGKSYEQEIEAAELMFHFDCKIHKSITDPEGVVVVLEKICRKA